MGLESGVQGGCVWTLRDTRSLGFNGHDVNDGKCWVEVAQEVVAMERLKGEQRARELPRSESVLAFLSAVGNTQTFQILTDVHTDSRA